MALGILGEDARCARVKRPIARWENKCMKEEDMETCLQCLQHGGELWNFWGGSEGKTH